jgi:Bacterial SH3 domain
MVRIVEATKGKIRDKPISKKLRTVLTKAGEAAGIDVVRITSGGQDPLGSGGKRTGSTRHDNGNAADLELWQDGRVLDFTLDAQRRTVASFITAAAANGATGIGAGVEYMGSKTIHVGFGAKLVWGKGGRSANAPAWLRAAAEAGWNRTVGSSPGSNREHIVTARNGLRLRGGPGTEFEVITTLKAGTIVTVAGFDGSGGEWARVDLEGDGRLDGHMLAAFLAPVVGRGRSKAATRFRSADEADGSHGEEE